MSLGRMGGAVLRHTTGAEDETRRDKGKANQHSV